MHRNKLVAKLTQDIYCELWKSWFFALQNTLCIFDRGPSPLWNDDAKFGKQTAKHVAQLRSLPDDQIARAMQEEHGLLFPGLGSNKPHRRTRHCFADGFSIIGVGLAAFDVGFYIIGWDQANIMPKFAEFPRPVMTGSTRLHADQAGFQIGEELHELCSADCAIEDNLPILGNSVDLENMFGQIDAHCCNLHWVAPVRVHRRSRGIFMRDILRREGAKFVG